MDLKEQIEKTCHLDDGQKALLKCVPAFAPTPEVEWPTSGLPMTEKVGEYSWQQHKLDGDKCRAAYAESKLTAALGRVAELERTISGIVIGAKGVAATLKQAANEMRTKYANEEGLAGAYNKGALSGLSLGIDLTESFTAALLTPEPK